MKFDEKEKIVVNESMIIINSLIEDLNELKLNLDSSDKAMKIFSITCISIINEYFTKGEEPQFHKDLKKRNSEYLIALNRHIKGKVMN